jgi:DNA oxidative demethylase
MNQPISLRLFDEPARKKEEIWVSPGAVILAGYAREQMDALFADLCAVEAASPFRHMVTRQGFEIHVETTGCGPLSWVSDRSGYRYERTDPMTGKPWPPMPQSFFDVARSAAATAGYAAFTPDSVLINRYNPDTTSALHRDGEQDTSQPVVTISVGVSVSFMWGGNERTDKTKAHAHARRRDGVWRTVSPVFSWREATQRRRDTSAHGRTPLQHHAPKSVVGRSRSSMEALSLPSTPEREA